MSRVSPCSCSSPVASAWLAARDGAGFCSCQACLGAAQLHRVGHDAQSPALSCVLPAAGCSLQSAGRSRLDSIKNGFLLGVRCYFYSFPSCFGAMTAVQSSHSAHLLGNTHPAWWNLRAMPTSSEALTSSHLPTHKKFQQRGHCHGGLPQGFLPLSFAPEMVQDADEKTCELEQKHTATAQARVPFFQS